ncbi:ankyrin repeat and fibronectin type-III domain-containing protein 1 [Oncorhynchus kisutch]|uniref:Ankyrin repeat and fibronectin type-III domain-containing protein 1 n=1 Tax=Oncorhynchus kisutch TaxID=8019 RepID=A0A8C7M2B5_ONCKI|nr:ankyrin repeat and fibronectin type-III domain-containing protein 1 [Oncorhynchus kisutch]
MSVSVRNPPQRRRSLGPVLPKRIYRNLSVRLRGGESSFSGETDMPKHPCKATHTYQNLWEAVEKEDTLAVQSLLCRDRVCGGGGGRDKEKKEKDWEREREKGVNRVSEQGLVPLDVAALTQNSPLLHVLTKAGARHNPVLCLPAEWLCKLDALVMLADRQVEDRREELLGGAGAGPHVQADIQRQLHLWTLRQQLYCRMRESFHHTDLPGPPSSVSLFVTSASSLFVSIREPNGIATGLITRYRVEWSTSANFKSILGSAQVIDTKTPIHSITGLTTGMHYFVRVTAYNVKGWGPAQSSSPVSAAPSSWRECMGVKTPSRNKEALARRLLEQTREPHYKGYCIESCKPQSPSKRLSMSRSLKLLFQSATKFVRLLQRGVYLATVFYRKENILVTADDQLPLVEIQCCSTSVSQDFLWFAKLSCAWQQVPWLQQALSSALSSSSSLLQNRHNILQAVAQLQSSLGTVDLGQVYYEPLKDRQGNVLLVTVKDCAAHTKPPDLPLHWVPLAWLEKNRSRTPLLPEPTAMDTLTEQLKEKLSFHRRSVQWAQPGLYVGILKLCSTVEQIRVLVPQRLPNLLCHARVRHIPHVSRDEWAWLQSHNMLTANEDTEDVDETSVDSSGLGDFVRSLRAAVTLLLTKLNIPLYRAYQYGVYTRELLQFGDKMSMLLLLPPSEDFSSSYWPLVGTKEPGLTMPLQIFELVHFWTYEQDFLSQYCQVWVRLELDAHLSQQALREALDTKEVQEARDRLGHITQLSQSLEVVWREARWIMDVLQCVRSKQWVGAVPLGLVMGGDPPACPDDEEDDRPTTRVWPQCILPQKKISESITCTVTDVGVSSGISEPICIPGVHEKAVSLIEGASKGGYPVDLSAQHPVVVFNSLDQSGVGFDIVAQSEVVYHNIMAQSEVTDHDIVNLPAAYSGELEYPHSFVSDVIPPLPELDIIFPTLSLIDEEREEDPVPGRMDMLDSLSLGVGESEAFFGLNSDLMRGPKGCSLSDVHHDTNSLTAGLSLGDRTCADTLFSGHLDRLATSASLPIVRTTPAQSWDLPTEDTMIHAGNRGGSMPARSQVEWENSSNQAS